MRTSRSKVCVYDCGTTLLERMTLKIATARITHAYHSSHLSFSCVELVSSVRFDKVQVVRQVTVHVDHPVFVVGVLAS